jgi:hypothetical protein
MDFLEKLNTEKTAGNKKRFAELLGITAQNLNVILKSKKQIYYAKEAMLILGGGYHSRIEKGYLVQLKVTKLKNDVELKNGKWTFNGKSFDELNPKEKIELYQFIKNQK